MKYAEFAALCEREFADGGGDVVALNLTNASLVELTSDVLNAPGSFRCFLPEGEDLSTPSSSAGALLAGITNPASLSKVTVTKDADRDTATVTRVVALG